MHKVVEVSGVSWGEQNMKQDNTYWGCMRMRPTKRADCLAYTSEYEEECCAREARTDQTLSRGVCQVDNGRMGVLR